THRHLGLSQVALPVCVPRHPPSTAYGSRTRLACLRGRRPRRKSNAASIQSPRRDLNPHPSASHSDAPPIALLEDPSHHPALFATTEPSHPFTRTSHPERLAGVEPTCPAWRAGAWTARPQAHQVSGRRGSRTLKSFWLRPVSSGLP